jgi:serine/threonine-protein phosphatase 6 regulatory subunit 3
MGDANGGTTSSEMMDEINLNGAANGGNNSDDEVVVGEDEELDESKNTMNDTSSSSTNFFSRLPGSNSGNGGALNFESENASAANDMGFFRFEASDKEESFGDRPLPDWVGWGEPSDMQVSGASMNPFVDHDESGSNLSTKPQIGCSPKAESVLSNGSPTSKDLIDGVGDSTQRSAAVPSLFEEDV